MCDVGYLCANFSLPMPLCCRVRPDVRDKQTSDVRQTDVRQKHHLMPPPYGGGSTIMVSGEAILQFMSAHSAPLDLLAGGEGICCPNPVSAFGLDFRPFSLSPPLLGRLHEHADVS